MFVYRLHFGSPLVPPTVQPFRQVAIPLLSKIPAIGPGVFTQYALTYIAWLLIPVVSILLYKTKMGLKIRTVGENPIVADTVGVNVNLTRTLCLVAGGALMGIGGAFLTLAHQNMFLIDVIGGRGWVAIAMVIFGNWDPLKGALGAMIFGLLDGLQLRLQGLGIDISFHIFLMIPYLLTIVALVGVSRRAAVPASLLKPYRREEKGG
jgi:simple sugar transport system permease protein